MCTPRVGVDDLNDDNGGIRRGGHLVDMNMDPSSGLHDHRMHLVNVYFLRFEQSHTLIGALNLS